MPFARTRAPRPAVERTSTPARAAAAAVAEPVADPGVARRRASLGHRLESIAVERAPVQRAAAAGPPIQRLRGGAALADAADEESTNEVMVHGQPDGGPRRRSSGDVVWHRDENGDHGRGPAPADLNPDAPAPAAPIRAWAAPAAAPAPARHGDAGTLETAGKYAGIASRVAGRGAANAGLVGGPIGVLNQPHVLG